MNNVSAMIVAQVQREIEQMEARDASLQLTPRSIRRRSGPSIVFSVRLDPAELAALEDRALDIGIKPTVLARNLIRSGLGSAYGPELAAAVDRLDAAVSEVRSALG